MDSTAYSPSKSAFTECHFYDEELSRAVGFISKHPSYKLSSFGLGNLLGHFWDWEEGWLSGCSTSPWGWGGAKSWGNLDFLTNSTASSTDPQQEQDRGSCRSAAELGEPLGSSCRSLCHCAPQCFQGSNPNNGFSVLPNGLRGLIPASSPCQVPGRWQGLLPSPGHGSTAHGLPSRPCLGSHPCPQLSSTQK